MIPENVEYFKTDGERQFYKFLEAIAKPDSRYFAWYTPDIKDRESDFILDKIFSSVKNEDLTPKLFAPIQKTHFEKPTINKKNNPRIIKPG